MEKLTPREEELMRCFWTRGPLFVRELVALWPEPKPHFNTLSTMVRGLEAKGYVGHKAYGGTYQYYPLVSEEEFSRKTLKGVVSKFRQFLPRGGFVARTGGENLRGRSARPDPANRKSNRKTIVLCRPFCFTV